MPRIKSPETPLEIHGKKIEAIEMYPPEMRMTPYERLKNAVRELINLSDTYPQIPMADYEREIEYLRELVK